jgi:hypothetical protein
MLINQSINQSTWHSTASFNTYFHIRTSTHALILSAIWLCCVLSCCQCSAVACTQCSTLSSGSSPASQWMHFADSTYHTEITHSGSCSCHGKEAVIPSICSLLWGCYITYVNSKHVHFVLLLRIRFPYRELLFWVVTQRVVVITTTRRVITQKNAVLHLLHGGSLKSCRFPYCLIN